MRRNWNFNYIFLSVIILTLLAVTSFVIAVDFTASEAGANVLVASTNRTLNISVNNQNTTGNITIVAIEYPSGMEFINDTNTTSATGSSFTSNSTHIIWTNATDNGIVENGTIENFLFRAFMPSANNSYNLTVISTDTADLTNTSIVTITVIGNGSATGNFSSHHVAINMNWSSTNLTLESNVAGVQLYVDNNVQNPNIFPDYFTESSYIADSYPALDVTSRLKCVSSGSGMTFQVSPSNLTGVLNETDTTNLTIIPYAFCPPGKYFGDFYVRNVSASTDNVMILANVNIPISWNNTFNWGSNKAWFSGTNTSIQNHSFYFFTNMTSSIPLNVTGVSINLTGLSSNVDMFLVDNSNNLLSKSIKTGTGEDRIEFMRLPATVGLWRIIMGNVTSSYTGYLYFTTLNSTNITTSNQFTNLYYNNLNANQSRSIPFTLRNQDDTDLEYVYERTNVYKVQNFTGSAQGEYNLLIPNFATKVRVGLIWSNGSVDWNLIVKDNNGNSIGTSSSNSHNANLTWPGELEEFVEYSSWFNTSNQGFWNITVANSSNITSAYTVTTKIWFSPSEWVDSTWTNFTFNSTNTDRNVTVNISVPTYNNMNGTYEGFVSYLNDSGWEYRIPISFTVATGSFMVNDSFTPSAVELTDNIGFNRTFSFNVSLNNTGDYPVYYTATDSAYLNYTNETYVYLSTVTPTSPVPANTASAINITLIVDTNKTQDNVGIYKGWVFINTTNSNLTRSSLPYQTFNVSVELNLTDALNVTVMEVLPTLVGNVSTGGNVTYNVSVRLMNGTIISTSTMMGVTNFSDPMMIGMNVSSYTINLTDRDGTGLGCGTEQCLINFTVPPNKVGGRYNASLKVTWNTSIVGGTGANLVSTGVYENLSYNETGLNISAITPLTFDVEDDETGNITVYLTNFGPVTAKGNLWAVSSNSLKADVNTTTKYATGCRSDQGYSNFVLEISQNEICWFTYIVNAKNVSGNEEITITLYTTDQNFYNLSYAVTIVDDDSSGDGGDSSSSSSSGGDNSCEDDSDCAGSYFCNSNDECQVLDCDLDEYVSSHKCVKYQIELKDFDTKLSVVQGGSVSAQVTVAEKNSKSIKTYLNVSMDESVKVTVTPTLSCPVPCTYNITFESTNSTEIGEYTGIYKGYFNIDNSVSKSETFTLAVQPTEEGAYSIIATCNDFIAKIDPLQQEFDSLKLLGIIPAGNLTAMTELMDKILDLKKQIQDALDSKDYIGADSLSQELNSTIVDMQDKFSAFRAGGPPIFSADMLTWIVVGVVIVGIVVFLVYLLLPPTNRPRRKSGFAPKKSKMKFKFPNPFKRQKKTPESEVKRISKYASGYIKRKSFIYKKKDGRFGKLGKKKQKRLKDFR